MQLTLEQLNFSYPGHPVLRELSWTFGPGLHVLAGDSGVGKTTLLRLIAGLLVPASGRIQRNEETLSESGRLVLPPPGRDIMLMTQDNSLWPGFTAAGNVRAVLRGKGQSRANAERLALEQLEATGASALASHSLRSLSGGQARRVELARAFAADSSILLLDEPFSGLNDEALPDLVTAVQEHAQQNSRIVIVCTHHPEILSTATLHLKLKEGGLCEY